MEVYNIAYDAVGKRLAAAAQDNGVTIQSARNAPLWNAVMGADGTNVFVNDVTLATRARNWGKDPASQSSGWLGAVQRPRLAAPTLPQ
jgi:hypothetical protein